MLIFFYKRGERYYKKGKQLDELLRLYHKGHVGILTSKSILLVETERYEIPSEFYL